MPTIRYVAALFVSSFITLYFIGWFVSLEPDVTLWYAPGRLALVMLAVFLTVGVAHVSVLLKREH